MPDKIPNGDEGAWCDWVWAITVIVLAIVVLSALIQGWTGG